MRYLFLGLMVAVISGCQSPYLDPLSLAKNQSMLTVQAANLPVRVAGYPNTEKLQDRNFYAPWFKVDEEKREVVSGGVINLRVTYFGDDDGDQVSFWWECRRGNFTYWTPTATYVSWQAPVVTTDDVIPIVATISDGRGKRSYKTIFVTVKAQVSAKDLILGDVKYYPIVEPPAGQPPVYYPGEDVKVEWTTRNVSYERFYDISLCVWLSPDASVPNAQPQEQLNLGTFEPGELKYRYTNFYLNYNISPGYYYLVLKTDCENLVAESNEENNLGFLNIWVRPYGSARR